MVGDLDCDHKGGCETGVKLSEAHTIDYLKIIEKICLKVLSHIHFVCKEIIQLILQKETIMCFY